MPICLTPLGIQNFSLLSKNKAFLHFAGHKSSKSAASLGLCRFMSKNVASLHEATPRRAAEYLSLCRLCRLCRENRINQLQKTNLYIPQAIIILPTLLIL